MSTASRIDELRKKFEENPRRYFAPLANELRKSGELSQAITLCREYLPKQPGHMSGHIVFGQALYEAEELDEARDIFEAALALDPENLIALRHLGDIARRQGDPQAARRWYERVLDADPRNDDIAAQLEALARWRNTPIQVPSVLSASSEFASPAPEIPADVQPVEPLDEFQPAVIDLGATPAAGVPISVVEHSTRDLMPVSFTPTVPVPIVAPLSPTPDAASRAVDLDIFNPFAPQSAPIEIPEATESVDSGNPAAPSLLDLDQLDGVGPAAGEPPVAGEIVLETTVSEVGEEASAAVANQVPAELVDEATEAVADEASIEQFADAPAYEDVIDSVGDDWDSDPFAFDIPGEEGVGAEDAEIAGLLEDESSFEEGLIAPVWPDTSDLVARLATPRSLTPISVEFTADAAEAFGRESGDPTTSSHVELRAEPRVEPDTEPQAESGTEPQAESGTEPQAELCAEDQVAPDTQLDTEPDPEVVGACVDQATEDMPADEPEAPVVENTFVTETMAELYVSQGFTDRAIGVYEELVRLHPHDPLLASRLAELSDQVSQAAPASQPADVPESMVEVPEPLSDAMVTPPDGGEIFAQSVSAEWPQEKEGQDPLESTKMVFTARSRFAALAARRVERRTPRYSMAAIVPAPANPVEAPEPEGSLSSLFASGNVEPADDMAARSIADAFGQQDAESAQQDDDFRSFFDSVDSEPEHYGRVLTPLSAPSIELSATREQDSFDRFFPDPARPHSPAAGSPAINASDEDTSASQAPLPPPPATDDLAQFSAWLKGLGRS